MSRLILNQRELIEYWDEKFRKQFGFSIVKEQGMYELEDWADSDFYTEYHELLESEAAMKIGEIK